METDKCAASAAPANGRFFGDEEDGYDDAREREAEGDEHRDGTNERAREERSERGAEGRAEGEGEAAERAEGSEGAAAR